MYNSPRLIMSILVSALFWSMPATASWQNHNDIVKTRIVQVENPVNAEKTLFVWEAELADGWKTYWRSPGEAGLPVRVIQSGQELELEYPLPERFELFGLETFGYGTQVMMPFTPVDASPVTVDFMVCKDVCIPFTSDHILPESPDTSPITSVRLDVWLAKIPVKAEPDTGPILVSAASVKGPVGRERLVVDASSAAGFQKGDVLAEMTGGYHFLKPAVSIRGDGSNARFVLDVLASKSAGSLRGKDVRLTIVDDAGQSIDTIVTLK